MDKDRIVGSAKEVKGSIKEAVGKAVGDAKLQSEGKSDQLEGKIQNAVGGVKDTIRDAVKKWSHGPVQRLHRTVSETEHSRTGGPWVRFSSSSS